MIDIIRYYKLVNKNVRILTHGLCAKSIYGRLTGPKVLVNSVPKAGTNLLQELMQNIPIMRGRITRTFSLKNGEKYLVNQLSNIKKGQCVPAHISYNAEIDRAMGKLGIRHILIIRDFRDVILSNIKYLDGIHKSHPHNLVFAKLTTLDEKIDACLNGVPEVKMMAWPVLINRYRSWLNSDKVLVVHYENLVSKNKKVSEDEIGRIVEYIGIHNDVDVAMIRKNMFNPRGLTFNAPGVAKWENGFAPYQISKLNEALGDELNFYGYEI